MQDYTPLQQARLKGLLSPAATNGWHSTRIHRACGSTRSLQAEPAQLMAHEFISFSPEANFAAWMPQLFLPVFIRNKQLKPGPGRHRASLYARIACHRST